MQQLIVSVKQVHVRQLCGETLLLNLRASELANAHIERCAVDRLMDLIDEVEYALHLRLLFLFESLRFLLVEAGDATLEVANLFFIGSLARFIYLIAAEHAQPGLFKASGLASVDRYSCEYLIVAEKLLVVLELVLVELAVVLIRDCQKSIGLLLFLLLLFNTSRVSR